jgi:hypothetical protein
MAARKPYSASDILRAASPRKHLGNTFFTANRFNHLLEPAPAPAVTPDRPRAGSFGQKRKNSNDGSTLSYATVVSGPDPVFGTANATSSTEHVQIELTKVRSLCEKAAIDISESNADVGVLSILKTINDAVFGLCNVVGQQNKPNTSQNTMVNLGAIPKRAKVTGMSQSSTGTSQNVTGMAKKQQAPPPSSNPPRAVPTEIMDTDSEISPEMQAFRDAVKDAEKSTLVFNLNMGRVPIMNTDTMSKRATKSLTEMAALAEGRTADNPSKDTVALIDDMLSVSTGITFFGSTTKTYRNPKDKNSGLYCTVPVKYDFNDKDTRVRVEQILRAQCNVNCTTPYPPILRECIRKVITESRKEFPDNLVKVLVDTNNFCLRVARRAGEEEENGKGWHYAKDSIPLPKEALNVRSRKIPDNLTMPKATFSPKKIKKPSIDLPILPSQIESDDMSSSQSDSQS